VGGDFPSAKSQGFQVMPTDIRISPRKANQVWAYARAWLRVEIGGSATDEPLGKM
jgi:hypothetical protein